MISENNIDNIQLKDYEEFIHYQKDSYRDYSLHLKRLCDQLLTNRVIHSFICRTISKIYKINVKELSGRYSDGIENIINIYLNVIWAMTWDIDISSVTEKCLMNCWLRRRFASADKISAFFKHALEIGTNLAR